MDGMDREYELRQYVLTLLNVQDVRVADEIVKFMDEMPGGFLIYQADGSEKIIYANKALIRIFQCESLSEFLELTKNSFRGMVHPDDLEEVEDTILKQIADSQYDLDYVEYRIIRKDGEVRWIEDYGHFIRSKSSGDFFYVFLSDATDKITRQLTEKAALISEKKRHEQKIQTLMKEYDKERKIISQEHLRRLEVIEGLSVNYETILYADLDSDKILPYRLSCRTERQFKKRFETRGFIWYVTDYVNTWVHPEDRDIMLKATSIKYIRQKLLEYKTYYINYRVINGSEIQYLQLRVVNVGSRDHISQIVMGYRKVDEEIRREMEQNQVLEEALNNANLAIIAKNSFLSNMSHDMRTPLNAIFGFTSLAKMHMGDNSAITNYLNKIEASGRQLLDLIDKVLKISWAETNNMQIAEEECSLTEIIQDVYQGMLLKASEKNIALSVNFENLKHSEVCGDAGKLSQILLYLAENAVTYTKNDGRVELCIKELEASANDYIVYQFMIKDTGIGINEDFLENIFEPFEREKNTTFSGIHGTGLGLTIARSIVEMMGGKIEVDSEVGRGSTFTVTLRLRVCNRMNEEFSERDGMADIFQNQKVLLVEDNEINQEIETEILKEIGFLVETAENGSIAVEKVKNSKPGEFQLILMDIQMPVMDGRQAAEAIRSLNDPQLSRIPIIALSADAYESDKRMSMESGMDDHLPKPVDVPLLLEAIGRVLKKEGNEKEKY